MAYNIISFSFSSFLHQLPSKPNINSEYIWLRYPNVLAALPIINLIFTFLLFSAILSRSAFSRAILRSYYYWYFFLNIYSSAVICYIFYAISLLSFSRFSFAVSLFWVKSSAFFFNSSFLAFRYSSISEWTSFYVEKVVRIYYSYDFSFFWFCSNILLKLESSAEAYFCLYSISILFASIFCIKFSLNYWILLWFSAISFWYSRDYACLSCCNFFISMFKFFSFYKSLLIWSWLSSSWAIVSINLLVWPILIFSMSSSSREINILLSPLTFKESLSKSGFYLNSLHNFFVLSFNITESFAISAYTSSSYFFWVIWVKLALFKTS